MSVRRFRVNDRLLRAMYDHDEFLALTAKQRERLIRLLLRADADGVVRVRKAVLLRRFRMQEGYWDADVAIFVAAGLCVVTEAGYLDFGPMLERIGSEEESDWAQDVVEALLEEEDVERRRCPSDMPEETRKRQAARRSRQREARDTGESRVPVTNADRYSVRPALAGAVSETLLETSETVSETPADAEIPKPDSIYKVVREGAKPAHIEAWRAENQRLAEYSARELGDEHSVGMHIEVWNHARKRDKAVQNSHATDTVHSILAALKARRLSTGKAQGPGWTWAIRKFFDTISAPIILRPSRIDLAELAAVQAAVAGIPVFADTA